MKKPGFQEQWQRDVLRWRKRGKDDATIAIMLRRKVSEIGGVK